MLVSLLSSSLLTSAQEHLIWIVGSLSSSGINCPTGSNNKSNNNSAAAAAAAEVTKAMKSSTSGANANSNSVDVSVSMPAASAAAADLDDDSNHKEKSSSSSVSARDALLAAGAMPPLLKILESDPENLPLQRIGAWCLSSMVEGRYSNSSNDSNSGSAPKRKYPDAEDIDILALLTTLRRMLKEDDDEEILGFTCWALSHLCDGPAYHISAVIYETDWK